MPGVLCQDERLPIKFSAESRGVNYLTPYFADYESGIEDSGDIETESMIQLSGTRDDSFMTHENFTNENPGHSNCPDRRTDSPSCFEGFWNDSDSSLNGFLVGRRASLQSPSSRSSISSVFLPHSAPASTFDYSSQVVPIALQSALTTCAVPTISDISQTESNQEDSGAPLNCFIVDGKEESSHNQKSTSRSGSPPPYPHTPSVGGISQDPISIPTDLSDSNDSDTQKEKLLGPVADTVVCPNIGSHHQGREMINAVYALPIDVVFTLLFTNSKFMLDLHVARKTYDVVASAWQSNPETNQKIRQVTYTVTLPTNSFGPKVSHVTETQVISSFSKSCEIYTVDAEACNGGIPYADCFYISNHWCLTREAGTETRLVVWSEVKYKKSVWGFMRSVIDKNAFNGLKSLMMDLNGALLLEVDRTNQKRTRRRRRRCGSKGSDHLDPLTQGTPGDKVKDLLSHSTQIPFRKLTLPSILLEPESPPLKMTVLTVALLFLCVLLAVNSFLYYRLYALEDRVVNGVSSKHLNFGAPIFKKGDDAPIEEWVQILHEQEEFHSTEVERWRTAVSNAADYLRKAEESLRSLHESIPQKQASKIQSLLRRLQILQQMQGRKPPSTSSVNELEENKFNEQLYSKLESEL